MYAKELLVGLRVSTPKTDPGVPVVIVACLRLPVMPGPPRHANQIRVRDVPVVADRCAVGVAGGIVAAATQSHLLGRAAGEAPPPADPRRGVLSGPGRCGMAVPAEGVPALEHRLRV